MNQINKFSELQVGKEYNLISHQFNVTNKARLISHDYTPLNRSITYWQFSERGHKPISAEELKENFKNDVYVIGVFAFWEFELNNNTTITD